MQNETILNVFSGASDQNRLVLVRSTTLCGLEHLILRQETHSADVGWFVQNQVVIEPGQVAALKMTLSPANANRNTASVNSATNRRLNTGNRTDQPAASPVILQFEAAG
ncbi:MAG: hypothetical protein IT422_23555 [Pirellulaceae bacterium]|nr:hypothetical protein [Pirellulaceae bacterium]